MLQKNTRNNIGYTYTAFISYSRKDTRIAKWLHKNLENFAIPRAIRKELSLKSKKPFFPIFLDEEELSVSVSLSDDIKSALEDSKFLIVLCSPHSVVSCWVNEEILQFKLQGKSNNIIAVIIDGEPDAVAKGLREEVECFPENLCCHVNDEGLPTDNKIEPPLAADLRPSCLIEGKNILLTYSFWLKSYLSRRDGLLKIASGLLRIKYDELKHRDKIRQRWQAAIFTSISVILALIGTLLVNASREAREEAKTARYAKNYETLNYLEQNAAYSGRYIDAALWNIELWNLSHDSNGKIDNDSLLSSISFYLQRSPQLEAYSYLTAHRLVNNLVIELIVLHEKTTP
ncbi:hypothetical protein KKHLCK_16955 [Candidatus Electrothrix laxa]